MEDNISLVMRDAIQIFSEEDLKEKLRSGKKLTIKLGADPSKPDLHLGHTVILRKLKMLQDMGHDIVFVIGDFTAMIGDPTRKSKTRPKLTLDETRESGKTYFQQVTKILDADRTVIVYNSEWLNALSFSEVINLTSKYTLARMLERNDFSKRFKQGLPLSLHELLYPLAQGYDSVAICADIEVGGTDQTFNLLVGRELQRDYGQTPQVVMTFPLLLGLDGKAKMSKALHNYIGIDEPPEVMFEKIMKIPDELLIDYFTLTTDFTLDMAMDMITSDIMEARREYGKEIIRMYHGEEFIDEAVERYLEIASSRVPQEIDTVIIYKEKISGNTMSVCDLIRMAGLCSSNSEACQLILGKDIKIDNYVVTDVHAIITCVDGMVVSKGNNKSVSLKIEYTEG